MFDRICDTVRRMRHRRGFGVHSPLAFSMINRVIRQERRYSFYAYHFLDTPAERRILRLINFLHPARIEYNQDDAIAEKTVSHSGNIAKPEGYRLLIDTHSDAPFERLLEFLDTYPQSAIYCRHLTDTELHTLSHLVKSGLIFPAHRYSIILRREKMPLQIYEV